MSMFNWQISSGNGSSITASNDNTMVTSNFWIYWAVSVPLTLVVLLAWRLWWHYEKSYYQRKYPHVEAEPHIRSNTTIQDSLKAFIGKRLKAKEKV